LVHSANVPKLKNSCWKVCSGPCGYLKHSITKDAFIILQTPIMGARVLWLVSAVKWAVRLHTAGEVRYLQLPWWHCDELSSSYLLPSIVGN